ncbi:dihydropteroate synthase [Enterococcus avium]
MNKRQIMGILNVTPDSFSDGGKYDTSEKAIVQAQNLIVEGADIIDIGGQSTRPGFTEISSNQELDRILPVVKQLGIITDTPISVDTYYPDVAARVLESGATIINDVSGLQNPGMLEVIKHFKPFIVVTHCRFFEKNVVEDVRSFFCSTIEKCLSLGLEIERICFDPGIGFNKSREDDYMLIRKAKDIKLSGSPLLYGVSRKRIIGNLTGVNEPKNRDYGTVGASLYLMNEGVNIIRVHNVEALKSASTAFFENPNFTSLF